MVRNRGLEGVAGSLENFAKLKAQPDVNVYYTNEFLSAPPYKK